VGADLRLAAAALTQCAPLFPSVPSPTTPTPTGSPSSSPTGAPSAGAPTPGTTATTTPSEAALRACLGALRAAPTPQQIQQHQMALTRSRAVLATAVARAITTAGGMGQSATSQTASSQSSDGRTGGTGQSSAARLTADQGAATSAEAALSTAQRDLASATLSSPIAGTV